MPSVLMEVQRKIEVSWVKTPLRFLLFVLHYDPPMSLGQDLTSTLKHGLIDIRWTQ